MFLFRYSSRAYFIPVVLFTLSLVVGIIFALTYKVKVAIGRLDNALEAYAEVVKERQNQLRIPALLTLSGVIGAGILFFK